MKYYGIGEKFEYNSKVAEVVKGNGGGGIVIVMSVALMKNVALIYLVLCTALLHKEKIVAMFGIDL